VIVRDIAILAAGHFAVLATGVDNLTLEALKIDTNRDGINVDCCRNVRISGCSVNSPWDDGICLKSSFALGEQRATENVAINDCYVTGGFALGTMLNRTFRRANANDGQPTGRIKCGTESSGGFQSNDRTNTQTLWDAEKTHAEKTATIGTASLTMANLALEKAHGEKVKEFAKFERDEQTTVAAILKTMDPGLTPSNPPQDVAEALRFLDRNLTGLCESTHEFVTGTGGVNAVLRTFNILTTTGG
jgi:polygalacturonase